MGRFYIHLVLWTSMFGAGLTFLFGSCIVPLLVAIYIWTAFHVPWSQIPPGPFPDLSVFFSSLNIRLGLIWLGYYILAYIWSMYRSFSWRPIDDASSYRKTDPEPAVSRGWPGEQKSILVERCYQRYQEALARYNPQPVQLKTPPGFYYRRWNKVSWEGRWIILPELLLTPERIHSLLPLLAHKLAYYNSSDRKLQTVWKSFPSHSPWWMALTGNFLCLPVWIKGRVPWRRCEAMRVLDADTFAHYLGEGQSLEHDLRRCLAELERAGKRDYQVPSLIERIGHLEALRKEEHEQMRKLGLIPQEPPLVMDPPIPKLNQGWSNSLNSSLSDTDAIP